jgi:Protein of unknown function (DUF3460)
MKKYKSQATLFLEKLKSQNPHLEQAQREGRALLWDKPALSPEEVRGNQLAKVKQRAYVYGND